MLEVAIAKRLGAFTLDVAFSSDARTVALFGASGSGKSLTVRAIAGGVEPDRGRVVLDGVTLVDSDRGVWLPPQERGVGYVPQHYALFPHLSVAENVGYGLARSAGAAERARVGELIALVRLTGLEASRPRQLSGGQQQRVAIARALLVRPRILLLDEPFSALDALVRGELRTELRALQERLGFKAVLVTHDLAEVEALADHVVVMASGRALQGGPLAELRARPASAEVARLLGGR